MSDLNFASRDNGRTPMQWDSSENAQFTSGEPWLPVNDNYKNINVSVQDKDPNSILNHFRKMVKLRKDNEVLVYGDYQLLDENNEDVYAFTRTLNNETILVLLNFTNHDATIELPEISHVNQAMINNYHSVEINHSSIQLKPYQGILFKLN